MLIAQITDTHMLPPGEIAYGLVDTAAALEAAIKTVNAAKPDLVLHTGDFAHHGAPPAYALALDIFGGLDAPLYAIPGNHDDRANMRAAFEAFDWMPSDGADDAYIHYAFDAGPLRIVGLDTVIPGDADGALSPDRLAWLADTLNAAEARPTLIAQHHPPFAAGLDGFSKQPLEGVAALARLLGEHSQVVRIVAGHIHRSIAGMCGPVPAVVAPSASYPFAFDATADAPLSVSFEPPGVAMHLWREGHGLLSHTVQTGDFPAPKALLHHGKRLLPVSTPRQ